MSVITYDAGQMLLTIDDTGVERALGALSRKTPAVLKVAINRTARQARKDLISGAQKRYALTARGRAKLKQLKLTKSATNTNLAAEIRQNDMGLTLNASYFQHTPTVPFMGTSVYSAPAVQKVRTLKGGPMEDLTASAGKSKGFLISVRNAKAGNDHLMFANRILGSSTSNTVTHRGFPRWTNAAGDVEKAYDVNRIGASSQQRAVWYRGVDNAAAANLERFLEQRIEQVIEAAK